MDEKEVLEDMIPGRVPVEEVEPVDHTAAFRKAKQQREESAAVIAEHDEMLADMLFEMTMKEMEG